MSVVELCHCSHPFPMRSNNDFWKLLEWEFSTEEMRRPQIDSCSVKIVKLSEASQYRNNGTGTTF